SKGKKTRDYNRHPPDAKCNSFVNINQKLRIISGISLETAPFQIRHIRGRILGHGVALAPPEKRKFENTVFHFSQILP
ncbi:MAG TPA: hypothetical protein VK737_05480, partial [Opitutales bacterium]|nr:hypothetical protein [Opitutales bacterium]